jgi:hypothetical protein
LDVAAGGVSSVLVEEAVSAELLGLVKVLRALEREELLMLDKAELVELAELLRALEREELLRLDEAELLEPVEVLTLLEPVEGPVGAPVELGELDVDREVEVETTGDVVDGPVDLGEVDGDFLLLAKRAWGGRMRGWGSGQRRHSRAD